MANTSERYMQKVAKSLQKTIQKVAKMLTIFLFYDNNRINRGKLE